MTTTTPSTIALTPPERHKEFFAPAAISPGHLAEPYNVSGVLKIRKNTVAALPVPKLIVIEKEWSGSGISTAYAADDLVTCGVFEPGDEVVLRLAASATAVTIGDRLEPAADGTVRKRTGYLTDSSGGTANTTIADVEGTYTEATLANNFADLAAAVNQLGVIAIALESVDNSAGGSEAFIRCLLI